MPPLEDSPDTLMNIWERAEAKAEAFEKSIMGKAPAAAKPAEPEPKSDTEPAPPPAEGDDTAEPEKKPAPAAKVKPEPKEEPAAEDGDERKQLEELAKKLGMSVDGNRVAVQERVKFRQEKAEWRTKQEQRDVEFNAKVAEVRGELDKQYGRGAKAVECWDRGDFDGVAKALVDDAKADWKSLNKAGLQRIMSPEAKRIRELEEREKEREEAAQRAEAETKQRAAAAEQAKHVTAYKDRLRGQMAESQDRAIKALAKLPMFVDAVFDAQNEHWDRESPDTIPKPEEVVSLPLAGGPALIATAKELWQALSEAFGDPDALNQETPNGAGNRSAADSARPGKKPKTLSRNGAAEVSATGKPKTEQDFIRQWSARLAEAD
jgi:hypothetical protein